MSERTVFPLGIAVFAVLIGVGALSWATGVGAPKEPGPDNQPVRAAGSGTEASDTAGEIPGGAGTAENVCRVTGPALPLPDAVHEASGVALSRSHQGVLWTHSDAGQPVVVAVSTGGEVRGTVRITGAANRNWEDLAVGPCPGGSCLYLADIGDNQVDRTGITVYRVPEPDPADDASDAALALNATYPDGPHDAEAMFVDATGRIHIVTKGERGRIGIYRFPADPAGRTPATLEHVAWLSEAPVPRQQRITGASASPDGGWVALRTLSSVALYPAGSLLTGQLVEPTRFDLRSLDEPQGEGVALGAPGTMYLVSEAVRRRDAALLNRLACPTPR